MLGARRDDATATSARDPLALLRTMTRANFEGAVDEALEALEALSLCLPDDVCPWRAVNAMIDTLVMAGRYRAALALPDRWSPAAREQSARADLEYHVLSRVNAAEALYNLGRLDEARALVHELERECDERSEAHAGVRLQQAWIAVLAREPERALQLAELATRLPRSYRAELCYTRAFALSLLGQHERASREAQRGFRLSVRVSSFRNGLFLHGAIAQRAGELEQAARHFEAGSVHPYRAQGGGALVCYGDTLRALGRSAEAEAAYLCALARDPESIACDDARTRLRELGEMR